jgi:DNA-binding SARP family transcriptional activator/ABC-type glycerol-3-phosphate transport system substrate-binding protein/predicted ATPase
MQRSRLEFRLLGTPRLSVDGEALNGLLFNKDLAIVCYLAMMRSPQPRSSLAAIFWGDLGDDAARGNLRKTLSNLRPILGEFLAIERDVVGLVHDRLAVDARQFEQLAQEAIASGELQRLATAAERYTGDFMAGFVVHNAPDYELWQGQLHDHLRELAVRTLLALAARCAEAGAYAPAADAYQHALDLEPWREDAHYGLILALAHDGQRSAALHQYQRCVETLARELAVEPSDDIKTLHAQIIQGKIGPVALVKAGSVLRPDEARPMPAPLPRQLTPMIGRDVELRELAALMATPDCRLINILGPGGIGKSRLALALAHNVKDDYPALAFVSLTGVESVDAMIYALGHALHFDMSDARFTVDAVVALLSKHYEKLFLVLDNFEQLIPQGVAALEALLSGVPDLVCVVTSRAILNTTWEWRYELHELSYPASPDDLQLGDYDAVSLFLSIARRTRPRTPLRAAELPAVVNICQLVGGMPLGIELAAAQLGRIPVAAIVDLLSQDIAHFGVTLHNLPPRQRSLAATFEASWASLSPEERRALMHLAPIRGEFTLDAGLAIAGTGLPTFLRLVDASLVRASDAGLYSLHEVIRRLAEIKLAETPGAAVEAQHHYLHYYVAWGMAQTLEFAFLARYDKAELEHTLSSGLHHLKILWDRADDSAQRADIADALSVVQHALLTKQMAKAGNTFNFMATIDNPKPKAHSLPDAVESLDVIWLPTFAQQMLDLTEFLPERSELLPALLDACTIDGRLVAYPYNLEVGILYYRHDLLERYGFGHPPQTWEELETMAASIQAHERAAGNTNFWGYIWAGEPSEHMMGSFMEWLHSEGGGSIVEPDGRISVNNPATIAAITRAERWLGAISPPNLHEVREDDVMAMWLHGNAAMMRMWSVVYSLVKRSERGDRVSATILPAGAVRHAAALGGWPLAVRRECEDLSRAARLLQSIAGTSAQRRRALWPQPEAPSLTSLYHDAELLAHTPLFRELYQLIERGGLAVRPAKVAGALYPKVSTATMRAVASILYGGVDAGKAVALLAAQLAALFGRT